MKRLIKPLLAVAVVAMLALGISNITTTNHKVQFDKVELKSTDAKLKTLQVKYDHLNEQLNQTLQNGKASDEQLKKLQDEKQQLEQEKADLQRQVSLKQQQKASGGITATAYAATDPNSAKAFIYEHESGNNPGAINPSSGACGLGQALPCSKMPCSLSDYACQDKFFTGYAIARYGSWENAKAFWQANRWW